MPPQAAPALTRMPPIYGRRKQLPLHMNATHFPFPPPPPPRPSNIHTPACPMHVEGCFLGFPSTCCCRKPGQGPTCHTCPPSPLPSPGCHTP